MVESRRWLTILTHGVLLLAVIATGFRIYVAFVGVQTELAPFSPEFIESP